MLVADAASHEAAIVLAPAMGASRRESLPGQESGWAFCLSELPDHIEDVIHDDKQRCSSQYPQRYPLKRLNAVQPGCNASLCHLLVMKGLIEKDRKSTR